ncbi:MAG: DUF1820 family protein [Gammaproteobacteria bacterium]
MPPLADQTLYRIAFINQGKLYELYARKVYQADMYGFVVIEDLSFEETGGLVLDPSQERLKDEFSGVDRSFIPMHAVIRIDQVSRQGTAKIRDLDGNGATVMPFPGQPLPSGRDSGSS